MDSAVAEKKLNLDKSTWKLTKLGYLATEVSNRMDNPAESDYDRFVGLQHFVSGDLKIKNWGTTEGVGSSMKIFQAGDVLFARRNAYLRRASLVDFDGLCSGDAFVLREHHDRIVPGFLAFIVNSDALWDYANSNAAGTMSKRVKWRDLADYEFLLPPIEEQAQLAELLWAADELLNKKVELREKLINSKNSILNILFSLDWSESQVFFKNISKNEFKYLNFSQVCQESLFGPRFSSKLYDEKGNIASLRTTDINKDGVINYNTIPRAKLENNRIKDHFLKKGDLLISRSGTCGLTAVFEKHTIPVIPAAFLIRFRLSNTANPTYFRTYFNSEIGRHHTSRISSGAVQKNLTSKALLELSIPIPSKEIQDDIVERLKNFDTHLLTNHINSVNNLQKSLINQIF